MKNRIKTIALLLVIGFLLVTTIYISFLLRSESETAPTTIRKTKASARTYTRLLALNMPTVTSYPDVTETLTPLPTQGKYIADASSSVNPTAGAATTTPELTPSDSISPTTADLTPTLSAEVAPSESLTPTEVLLAKITSTPTLSATISATTVKVKTLPDSGWIKPLHLMFIFAFSLIIFSLLY